MSERMTERKLQQSHDMFRGLVYTLVKCRNMPLTAARIKMEADDLETEIRRCWGEIEGLRGVE